MITMIKEFRKFMITAVVMAVAFTGCVDKSDNPIISPDKPELKDYSERLVPVIDPRGASHGMVTLRFYKDMPNVAYVSISDFHEMMYPGTTVMVVPTGEHQFALTNPCGTATVDTDRDIFESDDFFNLPKITRLVENYYNQ